MVALSLQCLDLFSERSIAAALGQYGLSRRLRRIWRMLRDPPLYLRYKARVSRLSERRGVAACLLGHIVLRYGRTLRQPVGLASLEAVKGFTKRAFSAPLGLRGAIWIRGHLEHIPLCVAGLPENLVRGSPLGLQPTSML